MSEIFFKKYPTTAKNLIEAAPEIARSGDGIAVKVISEDDKKFPHSNVRVKILKAGKWASVGLNGKVYFNTGVDEKSLKKAKTFISNNRTKIEEFIKKVSSGIPLTPEDFLEFEGKTKVETSYKYAIGVQPLPDYFLLITYSGGEKRILDFKPLFAKYPQGKYFQDLKDLGLFNSVSIEGGDLHWPNDFDLSTDSYYDSTTEYKVAASLTS